MRATTSSIFDIFSVQAKLKIPFFQRGYVWNEDNWERFFQDLKNIIIEQNNNPNRTNVYFMGSIILRSDSGDNACVKDVIDGQQRLTTFVLFMKALYLILNRNILFQDQFMVRDFECNNKPKLTPNVYDSLTYNDIINLEIPQFKPIRNDSQIAKAFSYFCNKIRDLQLEGDEISPRLLLDAINQVRLVQIDVAETENAQQIFETINSAGMKLTTGELLKNYLFSEDMIELYETRWKPIFENIESTKFWEDKVVGGRNVSNHTENFFGCYMLLKTLDPAQRAILSFKDRQYYRKRDGLFEKFRTLLQKLNINKIDVIDEIVSYAELYKNTFDSSLLDDTLTRTPGIERIAHLMMMQDTWTMLPYILYILKSQPNANERTNIFRYLETYLMRRIVCGTSNNNYSDLFSENLIGQNINTFEGFRNYVNDVKARGNLLMPSNKEIEDALKTKNLKKDAITILYMLESRINANFVNDDFNNCHSTFVREQFLLDNETILRALPNNNFTLDVRKMAVNTLGNFIILRQKLSPKQKKSNWPKKRLYMLNGGKGLSLFNVLENGLECENWDVDLINQRNEFLARKINEIWAI